MWAEMLVRMTDVTDSAVRTAAPPLDFIQMVSRKRLSYMSSCIAVTSKLLPMATSEFWKVAIRCSCIFIDVTVTALLK